MPVKKVTKKVVKKATKKVPMTSSTTAGGSLVRRRRPVRNARGNSTNSLLADAMNRLAAAQERNDPDVRDAKAEAAYKRNQKLAIKEQKARIAAGTFHVEDLEQVVKIGDTLMTYFQGEPIAGRVLSHHIFNTFMGPVYEVSLRSIANHEDGKFGYVDNNIRIKAWPGKRTWSEISIRPLSPEMETRLSERGRIFRSAVTKPAYMDYTGEVYQPSWMGWFPMGGNGRVMVDAVGCRTMQPHVLGSMLSDFRETDDDDDTQFEIGDAELHFTAPYVSVFSFRQKRWAAAKVDGLTPITFQTNVFDKLVLDTDKKFIIKSLVEHSGSSFADIIGGKSGGFIFLLHGPPGVGKTLTAEATAETLERPLYMVSVGELGTSPQQLEAKLSQILELADRWNAVLLLDEADIFLEQRTDHDMERNAMVGIFLRLLEYFNGVMFLTTNRVKNFDKAFHSRISLAINYDEMDSTVRRQVWVNLLTAANIQIGGKNGIDIEKLVVMPLNGRQIKNSIRLAQTIAIAKNQSVDEPLLLAMSKYAEEFVTSLNSAKNYA